MSKHQHPTQPKTSVDISADLLRYLLWAAVGLNSVFLIWNCLDRYLAPRFLLLSVVLLLALLFAAYHHKRFQNRAADGFDGLFALWYGWNIASVFWAFERSEAIFYTQKVLLLWVAYSMFSWLLFTQEALFRRVLWQVSTALSWLLSLVLLCQIGSAWQENGLDNETLYRYASGLSGNKGLAADFLFFLLIWQLLLYKEAPRMVLVYSNAALLLVLILALQTRTVYLATGAGVVLYVLGRSIFEGDFRKKYVKTIAAAALLGAGLLAAIVLNGNGSLSERLNPAHYLDSASANERRFVWYKTDLLCADHFWKGVGNGSWKIWFPSKRLEGAYRLQEKNIVFTRAHNDYLEIRAELGIIGALLFVGLFIVAAIALLLAALRRYKEGHLIWSLAAGLFGYAIIQYFDFPRERIEMQVMLALFLAWSLHILPTGWLRISLPFRAQQVLWALAVVLLSFNIVVGTYRVRGEIASVRMAKAYIAGNYPLTLRESRAARNPWHQYNDVVLPFWWFEGVAQYRMKNIQESVAAFEQAQYLNPWSFQVLNNYGSALAGLGRYEAAIPILEQAVYINPKYDEGKFNLAWLYAQSGNFDKALEWTQKADTIPNPANEAERAKNKRTLDTKAHTEAALRAGKVPK